MKEDFNGQVALITGGTSGIGLATARRLLCKKAKVLLVGRDEEKGQWALKQLNKYGANVAFCSLDVRVYRDCALAVEKTIEKFGRLDIVVNSAGIYQEKAIEEVTEEEFQEIMDVNIKGTYFISKFAVPWLKKVGGGAIINVSSDAGINGNCLCTAYCASKGAVTVFTKALALEVIPYGIRVNCVCPGDIVTPMLEKQLARIENKEQYLQEMQDVYPIRRLGQPEEVATVICFLASKEASLVVGAAWSVDGGLTSC